MKALIVDDYGPVQDAHIADIDRPSVKDGHMLVRLHAAAVNPFDAKVVAGMVRDMMHISFPYVPGMDGAGVIAELGSGVDNWRKGDAVLGMFATGTLAEYALISAKSKRLARKPEALDFEHAAAIPLVGLTATTILRTAGMSDGQTVFIIGATGGIGLFLTQLAKARGARVAVTAKADDTAYMHRLGADDVIDYASGDVFAHVRALSPNGVDVVIDLVNSGEALLHDGRIIRRGGTLISTLGGPEQDAFPDGVAVRYIQTHPNDGDLDALARGVASGNLQVEIGRTYDLADAAQALADLSDPAKHTRGKLVIRIA